MGPPFEAAVVATGKARAWGLTDVPITYDPPLKDPSELAVEREAKADGPDLFVCWMQKAPARQLVNGHMVMIEKNNLDIARVVDEWAQKNVK